MHTVLPLVIGVIGLALMAVQIYAESEPGALPLLLVLVGFGWYVVARVRRRPRR
jgi:hypothetical protein